jgi:N6-adenosine-specific RNA methylase IME4
MTVHFEAHDRANLFPMMEGAAFDALRDDIAANGLIDPIWIFEEKLLDGRNRVKACIAAGIDIHPTMIKQFDVATMGDPLQWVISKNLKRRHLDEGQRSYVAAKIENMPSHRPADKGANLHTSRDTAATMMNVSRRSVASAAVVRDKAAPELQSAVEQGQIAISVAAKAATLPVADQREIAAKAKAGDTNAARTHTKQKARKAKEEKLGLAQIALPTKKYGVIVADPEWKFDVWSEKGKDRAAENHYPVSALDEIKARDIPSISAEDCVLFLWATSPMLPQCLEVMKAWDFTYKSNFCWGKNKAGTGYWNRNTHELLLIGTRGHVPAPAMGTQYHSLINAPISEHSAKPDIFLEIIENYFPSLPKIELNRRGAARPGWDAWGNEVTVAGDANNANVEDAAR